MSVETVSRAHGWYNDGSRYLTFEDQGVNLLDSQKLELGDSQDSVVYYDGTDTIWHLTAAGSGDIIFAFASGFPSPDTDNFVIWHGSAGAVAAEGPGLTVEHNAAVNINILTPNNVISALYFGDADDNDVGGIKYDHSNTRMAIRVEGTDRLFYSAATFAFQESTTLSTTSGDLILAPTESVIVPNGTVTVPAIAFSGDTGMGFFRRTGGVMSWTDGGTTWMEFLSANIVKVGSGVKIGWSSNADPSAAGEDTYLERSGSATMKLTGNLVPDADSTRDIGVQTSGQWANVWADLVNGAEISLENKWRMMESELYGYPAGWALGHSDKWVAGKSIWAAEDRDQYMEDESPVFAVTDDFIEYKGRRITPEVLDKILDLVLVEA